MNTYRFETETTMKEYNCEKWFIMSDIVRPVEIKADSLKNALEMWREKIIDRDYIEISKNAIKNKNAMYIDDKNGNVQQCGYVITGSTEFDKGDYSGYCKQFIDLWVTIKMVAYPEFETV